MAKKTALIIVDPQNDFLLKTGSLYVPDGELAVPDMNALRAMLKAKGVVDVFITQDWHPDNHISFYTQHPGTKALDTKILEDGMAQTMWPPHCTQNSQGAAFHADLVVEPTDTIVQKGTVRTVDSYSGFASNDGVKERTQLEPMLKARGVTDVIVCGVAFEYCVAFTALDAAKCGFGVTIVRSATRGISPSDCAAKTAEMEARNIRVVESVADAVANV